MPMEIPDEQATLFQEVLSVLEEKGVPYAVSGAFALRQHTGICRFTKDLDLFMTANDSRFGARGTGGVKTLRGQTGAF